MLIFSICFSAKFLAGQVRKTIKLGKISFFIVIYCYGSATRVSAPPSTYCHPTSLFLVLFKNKSKDELTRKNVCFGGGVSPKRFINKIVLCEERNCTLQILLLDSEEKRPE